MSIKFNIYYGPTVEGPWTLANVTPLDRIEGLQSYTIIGLNTNTIYYVSVVGGTLDSQDNFLPLISQPIGPSPIGAGDQNLRPVSPIGVRTFSPKIVTDTSLSHQYEVV